MSPEEICPLFGRELVNPAPAACAGGAIDIFLDDFGTDCRSGRSPFDLMLEVNN
jgi:hypothetical protein